MKERYSVLAYFQFSYLLEAPTHHLYERPLIKWPQRYMYLANSLQQKLSSTGTTLTVFFKKSRLGETRNTTRGNIRLCQEFTLLFLSQRECYYLRLLFPDVLGSKPFQDSSNVKCHACESNREVYYERHFQKKMSTDTSIHLQRNSGIFLQL